MKKEYIKPTMEVIKVKMRLMQNQSDPDNPQVHNTKGNGSQFSRRRNWGDEDEYEDEDW